MSAILDKLKCKFWGHLWNSEVSCVDVCERCEFIDEYGKPDGSLNLENKYTHFKWTLEMRLRDYVSFHKCGYCERWNIRILKRQISECSSDCLPF